jgi:hypothetical protein
MVGGQGQYSMATLDYSAFDPFFMVHHSSIDRIWVIWKELQKIRSIVTHIYSHIYTFSSQSQSQSHFIHLKKATHW